MHSFKTFVKEESKEQNVSISNHIIRESNLTGEEIKDFYEEIVNGPSENIKKRFKNRSNNLFNGSFQHSKKQREFQYCDVCGQSFSTPQKIHESSTAHLFAVNHAKFSKTFYGIPESNKGFQILIKSGWDKEKGLGPEGTGRKFPVKATKMPGRAGIGSNAKRKIIKGKNIQRTNDAVTQIPRKSSRLQERAFEAYFRMQFS